MRNQDNGLENLFEKRWRVLFESDSAWINVCDSCCTIIEVNQAGVEIMEADGPEQLVGTRLPELICKGREDQISVCEQEIQQGRERRTQIELTNFRGHRRVLEVTLVPFPDNAAGEERFFSILTDRTSEQEARKALRQRQEELAQIVRVNMLGEVALGLAHELNQPLAAIQNYIEGCQRRIEASSCNKADFIFVLERMGEQISRAVSTLSEVRHFFRKDDSRIKAEDISQVIIDAVNLWKTLTSDDTAQFHIEADEGLPLILVNPVQIEQVLLNLIRNAEESVRADSEGKVPVINISARKRDENMVKITVSDNGSGLPEEGIGNIWNQFVTTKQDGMGLGLPICRSIIEAHRGQIMARNNKQGGAEFSFTLPVAQPEVEYLD